MFDDYPVSSLSNAEVMAAGKQLRKYFGVDENDFIDVLECASRPKIWTTRGEKRLSFEIWSDEQMGRSSGLTTYREGEIVIAVKRSVRHGAFLGMGRDRNTIAHEFGHAVLHEGAPKHRRTQGNTKYGFIRPFESAEHQANVFAPSFLINDKTGEALLTPEDVSITFGLSLESAKIYFEQIREKKNRDETAKRIRRIADEFKASQLPAAKTTNFLNEPCTVCGQRKLFPVGHKFMCQHCDTVFDRFQDGDTID